MEGKKKRRRKEEAELSLCIYKGLPLFPVAKSLDSLPTTHCEVKILFFLFFNTCWHLFSSHEKEKEEKLPTTIVNLAEEARRNEPP
jgi:hypothetical protein